MKIALASDLHLEFRSMALDNDEGADVLVLAGDICSAKHFDSRPEWADTYKGFFEDCSTKFDHIIYVMGNHEHYNYLFNDTHMQLIRHLGHIGNLHILNNQVAKIDDVTFVCGTLWTNMNNEDPLTMNAAVFAMPDFKIIKYNDGANYMKFRPELSVREHERTVDYINHVVRERHDDKFVVVTHHCPSPRSCHERYLTETLMNGAFNSDLDEFIAYRPQIRAWLHGHTHDAFDYMISETRIVCNPRGYPKESSHDNFKLKYLEV